MQHKPEKNMCGV